MNRFVVVRSMLVAVSAIVCMRCTIGPNAGTETGNPDITACCTASLALFDTADRWLPSTYLVEGETQLDPDMVYDAPPAALLAKRAAAADSTAGPPASTSGGVISRIDTIIVKDTVFVSDTLVIDTVVVDTIRSEIGTETGSSTVIAQRIRHDSIFVSDTVFTQDTFIVLRVDSSKAVSDVNAKSAEVRFGSMPEAGSIAEYSVVRNPVTGAVSLYVVPTPGLDAAANERSSFDVRSGSSCIMAARQLTIGETFISETFLDADGDGLLLSAAAGATALSRGSFIYHRGTAETQLQIDFDAGADNLFATISDNRIASLFRRSVKNTGSVEQIRYGAYFFGMTGDTIVLQRDCSYPVDSIESITDRFTCVSGSDPRNHRLNGCNGIVHTISYRSGRMRSMQINVAPLQPLTRGQSPGTGSVTAFIDYGKGLTGVLTGVIDFQQRTITGTYAQAGMEYHCYFDGINNSVNLQSFQ